MSAPACPISPIAMSRITKLMRQTILALSGLCCAAILALSPAQPARADNDEPPGRVGRISFTEGEVSFYADREDGWRRARLNFPVTSKNALWTNGHARAEVRIGASALRLDADSVLDFARVDDARTMLFLQRGQLNVRLRSYPSTSGVDSYGDTFRIETNEGVLTLQSNGRYRIDAAQDRNETRVSVFAGQARFDNGQATINIDAGKALQARNVGGLPSFSMDTATEAAFDRWAEARDTTWDSVHQRYAALRHISPRMTGYEDLDEHGDWLDDREYGRLWAPRVVIAGWAPYRHGTWAYVRPWGWTWVDNAPWGFAPFHYGRWVHRHSRWYWSPGSFSYRPIYAPALVGWVGRGNWTVSLTVGGGHGGGIGWFPLAPREHYVPYYSRNPVYIRNINNITNNITIVNPPSQFANQTPGSTVVSNHVIVNGEPVWPTAQRGQLNTAHVTAAQTGWSNATLTPPAGPVRTKPAVLNTTPSSVQPAPFVGGEAPRAQRGSPASIAANPPSATQTNMVVQGEAPRPAAMGNTSGNSKPGMVAGQSPMPPELPPLPMGRAVKPNPMVAPATVTSTPQPQPQFDSPTQIRKKPGVDASQVANQHAPDNDEHHQRRLHPQQHQERQQHEARMEAQRQHRTERMERTARHERSDRQERGETRAVQRESAPPVAFIPPAIKPKPAMDPHQSSKNDKPESAERPERAERHARVEQGGKIGRAAQQ
jgi:hypothetical protein